MGEWTQLEGIDQAVNEAHAAQQTRPSPTRVTRADKALTEMCEHREWLREHRAPLGDPWYERDVAREIGVTECMEILAKHGARCTCPSAEPRGKGSSGEAR